MSQCNIDLRHLASLLLLLVLAGCSREVPPATMQEMQAEMKSNWQALSEVESMSSAAQQHSSWITNYTDSVASPALYQRYQNDSLLRDKVSRMDERFQSWYLRQVYSTRNLRLHLTEVSRWLDRVRTEEQAAILVNRNWIARQETFARLLTECRVVQDAYLSLMEAYAKFDAQSPAPDGA